MTIEQITARQNIETHKFEAAREIRRILDDARKNADASGLDEDEYEAEILALVTDDE